MQLLYNVQQRKALQHLFVPYACTAAQSDLQARVPCAFTALAEMFANAVHLLMHVGNSSSGRLNLQSRALKPPFSSAAPGRRASASGQPCTLHHHDSNLSGSHEHQVPHDFTMLYQ